MSLQFSDIALPGVPELVLTVWVEEVDLVIERELVALAPHGDPVVPCLADRAEDEEDLGCGRRDLGKDIARDLRIQRTRVAGEEELGEDDHFGSGLCACERFLPQPFQVQLDIHAYPPGHMNFHGGISAQHRQCGYAALRLHG
jgi:hypothetical protein